LGCSASWVTPTRTSKKRAQPARRFGLDLAGPS
jgi:hypothetical protein